MADLILCDCFGVVLDEVAVPWFHEHFKDQKQADELKAKFFDRIDLGYVPLEDAFIEMEKELGYDRKELAEDWNRRIRLREDVLAYLQSLRAKGNKLVLVSNAGKPFMYGIVDTFDFKTHFDKIFLSCDYRMAKPDPKFYQLVLSAYDEKFDHIYMIDDNPKNLMPLESLGVKGILYTDLDSLKRELHF